MNISQESLDVDAQAAAWKSLASGKRASRSRDGNGERQDHGDPRLTHRSRSARLPATSRPVAQLARDSYLGVTLRNVGRSSAERQSRPRRGRSPSSSEPSSSSDEQTSLESDSSSEDRSRKRRDNRHGRNKRHKKRKSYSSSRLVIKPIAPEKYNGCADARSYHRFVRESEAYLCDGRVKGPRRIFLLSHYLTEKAYDFYTQKVANDEAFWSLSQFYDELFNYCFPVDYRMQVRKTLARCHQNEKRWLNTLTN